jgi:copper oxidase (laccase) domain-containing protein
MPFTNRMHPLFTLDRWANNIPTPCLRISGEPKSWDSLNVGALVEMIRAVENKLRCFRSLGRSVETMYDAWQVHSRDVVCTDAPRPPNAPHVKADAILTDRQTTLFMRLRCVPVCINSTPNWSVGSRRWLGTVGRTAARLWAMVSGTIQISRYRRLYWTFYWRHHYEISPEVADQVHVHLGSRSITLPSVG